MALGADDQMDVGGAPRAPVRGRGHLAGRPVERDRVRAGDHRADLVAAVGVGADLPAQVALGRAGHEARVAALGVGLPDVEVGVGDRVAVGVGDAAGEDRRIAGLVGTVGELERRVEDRRVGEMERAEDRALRAVAVGERLLLDDVLDVDVAEQRPLAGLADVDEPLLGGLVLLVGDVVLDDRLVDAPQDVADESGWRDRTRFSPRSMALGWRASGVTRMSRYGNSGRPDSSSCSSSTGADVEDADVRVAPGDAPQVRPAPVALRGLRVRPLGRLELVGLLGRHVGREADLHLGQEQHQRSSR